MPTFCTYGWTSDTVDSLKSEAARRIQCSAARRRVQYCTSASAAGVPGAVVEQRRTVILTPQADLPVTRDSPELPTPLRVVLRCRALMKDAQNSGLTAERMLQDFINLLSRRPLLDDQALQDALKFVADIDRCAPQMTDRVKEAVWLILEDPGLRLPASDLSPEDILIARLENDAAELTLKQNMLRQLVKDCRAAGIRWTEIARAIGTTRQAAVRKYDDAAKERNASYKRRTDTTQ